MYSYPSLSKYGGRGSYVGYRRYRVSSGLEERWVYNTGTVRTDISERLVIIDSVSFHLLSLRSSVESREKDRSLLSRKFSLANGNIT